MELQRWRNALTSNTTLTHLSISHFGERGFNSFASCLPFMNGLKELKFDYLERIDSGSSRCLSQGPRTQYRTRRNDLDETCMMILIQRCSAKK